MCHVTFKAISPQPFKNVWSIFGSRVFVNKGCVGFGLFADLIGLGGFMLFHIHKIPTRLTDSVRAWCLFSWYCFFTSIWWLQIVCSLCLKSSLRLWMLVFYLSPFTVGKGWGVRVCDQGIFWQEALAFLSLSPSTACTNAGVGSELICSAAPYLGLTKPGDCPGLSWLPPITQEGHCAYFLRCPLLHVF